jgi:hypothetical protein
MIDTEEYQKKRCTWSINKEALVDPHLHTKPYIIQFYNRNQVKKIYEDSIDMIGNTPVVRLNKNTKIRGS